MKAKLGTIILAILLQTSLGDSQKNDISSVESKLSTESSELASEIRTEPTVPSVVGKSPESGTLEAVAKPVSKPTAVA